MSLQGRKEYAQHLTDKDAETQGSHLPEVKSLNGVTDSKPGLPEPVPCSDSAGRDPVVKEDRSHRLCLHFYLLIPNVEPLICWWH